MLIYREVNVIVCVEGFPKTILVLEETLKYIINFICMYCYILFMFERLRRKKKPLSMRTLLSRAFHCSRRMVFVGDEFLETVTDEEMRDFLKSDTTNNLKWVKGIRECNIFALLLLASAKKWFIKKYWKNAAIGMAWRSGTATKEAHAFCYYVTPDLKVKLIEPQTDEIMKLETKGVFVYI